MTQENRLRVILENSQDLPSISDMFDKFVRREGYHERGLEGKIDIPDTTKPSAPQQDSGRQLITQDTHYLDVPVRYPRENEY